MFPSQWELLIIFLVVLLLFGAKRIPEMARGLGKGIREFRTAVKDVQEEVDLTGQTTASPRPNAIQAASPPEGQVPRGQGDQAAPVSSDAQSQQAAPAPHQEAR